jgi:Transcriptional regulator
MSDSNLVSRTLRILSALKGKSLHGMSNQDIAKACQLPASTVTRIVTTMVDEGYVMQLDTGRYALSVRMLAIAQAHADEMSRTIEKINELNQRVHAGARQ